MGDNDGTRRGMWRTRWAAVGAAVAVVAGAGGIGFASAAGEQPVSVAVAPCRLFDTRPGADNVGAKNTPLGEGDANAMTVQVTGASGRCNLPLEATSVRLNLTIVSPTASSFLTVFPADGTRPGASALNWSAGQAPTSNYAETTLSLNGRIKLFNRFGNVQVLADVTGYTVGHAPNQLDNDQLARGRWDLDPRRDLTTSIASVGPAVFDGRTLWVFQQGSATLGGAPGAELRVVPVDPSTGTAGAAAASTGFGQVSDSLRSTDSLFDGRSVWFTRTITSVGGGTPFSQSLVQFDTLTRTITRTVTLPLVPTALAFDGTNIWVGTATTNVLRVSAATGTVLSPNLNFSTVVSDLLFDGSKMWVNGTESGAAVSGTVFCVDPAAPSSTPTRLNSGTAGRLAFDGARVWTSNNESQVRIYNAGTCTFAGANIATASTATAMAFDGSKMWVRTGGGLSQVDATSLAVTTTGNLTTLTSADLLFDGSAVWTSSPLRRHRVG